MSKPIIHTGLGVVAVVAALGVTATLAGPSTSAEGLLACEFRLGEVNGMTMIEGIVHANDVVEGSYQLSVEGGGSARSARIKQVGEFDASPDAAATLGRVMLDSGGTYEANLEVHGAGSVVICKELIGRRI